jgi:hypothetical protein
MILLIPKHDIYMHGGGKEGFSVFKVGGWGDDDIVGVGDKTGENTLSVTYSTHSLSHAIKNKKDSESWGILSVSASFLSGYFERSPRHWCALPARTISWWAILMHSLPKDCPPT